MTPATAANKDATRRGSADLAEAWLVVPYRVPLEVALPNVAHQFLRLELEAEVTIFSRGSAVRERRVFAELAQVRGLLHMLWT